jgi:outer membrane protein TolC
MIPFLLVFVVFSAGDTLRLTLDDAIHMAVRQNMDYRIQSLSHTNAKIGFANRASDYLPQPLLQGSYSEYETQYSQGIPWKGYYVDLSVSQSIIDLQKLASIWGGKMDLDGSSAALEEARNSLSYDVENLFLMVLKETKNLGIKESALKRALENMRLIEAKERLGQASRLDLLNAKVAHNQSMLSLKAAQKNLKIAKRLFLNVLGMPTSRELLLESPPEPQPEEELPDLDVLFEDAYRMRPALKSNSKKVASANTDYLGQLLSVVPSLSYTWSWVYQGEEFPGPGRFRDEALRGSGLTAGLTFNPISYVLGVQRSRTALDIAKTELERERLIVRKQVEEAYFTYTSASENLELARVTLDAAGEGQELARAQYSVGLIKPLELFDSETRLLNAEADYLAAVYDLQLARSGLKFAVGGGF